MLILLCEACDGLKALPKGRTFIACACRRSSLTVTGTKMREQGSIVRGPGVIIALDDVTLKRARTNRRGAGMWWIERPDARAGEGAPKA